MRVSAGAEEGVPLFAGRLGLQQRVLPAYRAAFFESLATACREGFGLFAGYPMPGEAIRSADSLAAGLWVRARNIHFFRGPYYLCWQRGLLGWLRDWDPDALILEANPRYLSNWLALNWMKARGRPVLGWALGAPPVQGPLRRVREALRRRYLQGFDALIAYSQQGKRQYQALGFPEERIFVAYNAARMPPTSLPQREPLRDRALRLLFVGRLQRRKRLDLLFEAASRVEPGPEIAVVGEGPAGDELRRLAARIYPGAAFVGAQYGSELEALYHWADLFVLPGTGGLAIQEALCHGLPVIVAEGDGTQEDLVGFENGWLVPPGDDQALKRALEEALADPERLREMGARSYQAAQEHFNIEAMTQVFVKALQAVSGEG